MQITYPDLCLLDSYRLWLCNNFTDDWKGNHKMSKIDLNYDQLKSLRTDDQLDIRMTLNKAQKYKIGQVLDVREKWANINMQTLVEDGEQGNDCFIYQADYANTPSIDVDGVKYRWKAASTMPDALICQRVMITMMVFIDSSKVDVTFDLLK